MIKQEENILSRISKLEANQYGFKTSNTVLAKKYLESEIERLKSENGQSKEAIIRICKTMNSKISRCINILYWFNSYDMKSLTIEQLKKVYDRLEKGDLLSIKDKRLAERSLIKDYYSKEFKGELGFFSFIGINHLARKVFKRKFSQKKVVEIFDIEDLRKMVKSTDKTIHQLVLWLLFDTLGEVMAIVRLNRKDFYKKNNSWWYNIPLEISKKGREPRNQPVWFKETGQLLDLILPSLKDDEPLFNFREANVRKLVRNVSKKAGVKTKPHNNRVKVKDFRSSGNTYFLGLKEWKSEDVNIRSGRKPYSQVINDYLRGAAINQNRLLEEKKQLEEIDNQSQIQKLKQIDKKRELELKELREIVSQLINANQNNNQFEMEMYTLISQILTTKEPKTLRVGRGGEVIELDITARKYKDKRVKNKDKTKITEIHRIYD